MIQGKLQKDLVASIQVRTHEMLSGLSEKLGGRDEGPDPHELVEAALAACTILTCQLYANRKGWPLESTEVKVDITSESKTASVIQREIAFLGPLSEEQKSRLLEIADKCPIHNLLQSQIQIETRSKEPMSRSPF